MSKGGSTTSNTEIPAWLEGAAQENINRARDVSQIGHVPYYGPDVAAFSPMQQQSMRSTGNAASAFGLAPQGFDAMGGMPQAETFANGMQGYSSAPLFEQAKDNLFAKAPGQYNAMADMFINPNTGAGSHNNYGVTSPVQVAPPSGGGGGGFTPPSGGGGGGQTDGEYFGVNKEYNPYKYSTPTEDISGDGVVDYRDMSFGEGGRRDVSWTENIPKMLPFGNVPNVIDRIGTGLFNMSDKGDAPMTQSESMTQMNQANARYNARAAADLERGKVDTAGTSSSYYQPTIYNNDGSVQTQGGMMGDGGLMGNDAVTAEKYEEQYNLMNMTPQQQFEKKMEAEEAATAKVINAETARISQLAASRRERDNNPSGYDPSAPLDKAIGSQLRTSNGSLVKTSSGAPVYTKNPNTQAANIAIAKKAAEQKKKALAKKAADKKKADKKKVVKKKQTPVNTGGNGNGGVGAYTGVGATATTKIGGKSYANTGPPGGGGGGGGGGGSAGGSGGGTYCCTKMRENGDWTSNRRVYKMHKWHFEQSQWWRDGYDVWGKVIANNLLKEGGVFFPSVMNEFYENRVNNGKVTVKSALAHALMYPAIFTIGMIAKVTGKHIHSVSISS